MAIEITQHNDRQITVNDKLVQKDLNDNWVAKIELTQNEREELFNHIKSIENDTDNNLEPPDPTSYVWPWLFDNKHSKK